MDELPMLTDLTKLEQQVVNAARRGEAAKPTATMTVEELAATDDPKLRIRADLLRELLRGLHGDLDPRGIRIEGVRVVGQLDLDHIAAITGLDLRQCALPDGIVCRNAHLRYLCLSDSLLTHLNADGIRTNNNLKADGAVITGAGEFGAIRLVGAHIGGQLVLSRATVTNTTGPALAADRVRTDNELKADGAVIAGAGEFGAIRLLGAHISGQLDLSRATVTNTTGPALAADGLRTDSSFFMRDITITGARESSAIRLLGAHIGGQLTFSRATITNTTGPALAADRVHTDDNLRTDGAVITGAGEFGAIRLVGAHIGGELDLKRATITNTTGPALDADELRTAGGLHLADATITGAGELGAIRLPGAQVGGSADFLGSRLDNRSGPLLKLDEAQVAGSLQFPAAVVCPTGRQGASRRGCPDSARRITADGVTYRILLEISWRQWLHLLVHHTETYRPQPFQQLAATERVAGHDNNAREVLITQQHDLRRRAPQALGGWLARGRHALWGWLGRYGYRAHRLVTALAVILTLAAALSLLAGHVTTHPGHHAAERVPPTTAKPADPGTPCSPVELIGLGIDRGLPLGTTGIRAHCDFDTTTGWGQTFTAALWVLQALLWGLATLAIAAYTGLVRKPT